MFQRRTLTEPARRTVLKKQETRGSLPLNPANQMRRKLKKRSPSGPLLACWTLLSRVRGPMLGCQTGVTATVGSHLHPRNKQMKDTRSLEDHSRANERRTEEQVAPVNPGLECRIKERQSNEHSGGLLLRDPAPKGTVALPESRNKCGQLMLFHKNTFEPDGVKIEEVIHGHFKAKIIRLEILSTHLSSTTAKRCDVAKQLFGPAQESRRGKMTQTSLQVTSTPQPTANAERQG